MVYIDAHPSTYFASLRGWYPLKQGPFYAVAGPGVEGVFVVLYVQWLHLFGETQPGYHLVLSLGSKIDAQARVRHHGKRPKSAGSWSTRSLSRLHRME